METFNKKKAFGIGGILTGVVTIIAVVANISEIVQLFRGDDKPESSVAVVETVDKNIEESVIEQAESVGIIEQEEISTVTESSVVYLNSLKVAEKSDMFYENDDSAIDTIGNTYTGHLMIVGGQCNHGAEDYAIYYLGGKYKTLSGVVAMHDSTDNGSSAEVLISCDDNIIYSTGTMSRVSAPVEFSQINVEDCQWLKVSKISYHESIAFSYRNQVILHNWKLE